jgi:uncharacterized repeat protein (TIGR04076 family)
MKIEITVIEIKGRCPVCKLNNKILIDGAQIDQEQSDALCIHALPPLLHFSLALREGANPMKLGLSKEPRVAYLQCPDPGEPLTPGGTVIFKVRPLPKE